MAESITPTVCFYDTMADDGTTYDMPLNQLSAQNLIQSKSGSREHAFIETSKKILDIQKPGEKSSRPLKKYVAGIQSLNIELNIRP